MWSQKKILFNTFIYPTIHWLKGIQILLFVLPRIKTFLHVYHFTNLILCVIYIQIFGIIFIYIVNRMLCLPYKEGLWISYPDSCLNAPCIYESLKKIKNKSTVALINIRALEHITIILTNAAICAAGYCNQNENHEIPMFQFILETWIHFTIM